MIAAPGLRRGIPALLVLVLVLAGAEPATSADDTGADDTGADTDSQDEPRFAAPVVVTDASEVEPGDRLVLTIAGFEARAVTATICGNQARRGSADCDMIGSRAKELRADGESTVTDMVVTKPPMPCPCVVRVASRANDEVAVARLSIVGHPVAPVIGGATFSSPLSVSIEAERTSGGALDWVRTSIGGRTDYDVTVTVRNRSSETVDGIEVEAWAGKGDRVLEAFDVGAPERLQAGEVWEETTQVALPAPVWGATQWRIDVGGATESTVVGSWSTSNVPWLLYVLVAVLVVDLMVLALRAAARLRRTYADDELPPEVLGDGPVIDLRGPSPYVGGGV